MTEVRSLRKHAREHGYQDDCVWCVVWHAYATRDLEAMRELVERYPDLLLLEIL